MNECTPQWKVLIQRRLERTLHQLPDALLPEVFAAIQGFGNIVCGDAAQVSPKSIPPEDASAGGAEMTGFDNVWFIDVDDWRVTYAIEDDQHVILLVDVSPLRGL